MSTALLYDERFLEHDTGLHHPERAERLRAIVARLRRDGLWDRLVHLPFAPAEEERVLRLHTLEYLHRLRRACTGGRPFIDVPDSTISAHSDDIALLAVGAAIRAVDAVTKGEVGNAFCAVRPPGHHAEADRSMGFCLFATVALAAESLLNDHGLHRVAIVDFDVHHGNGTQRLFEANPHVLFISVHEDPATCYPGTGRPDEVGRGAGQGTTLNVALPAGSEDAAYQRVFAEQVVPKLDAFDPEFLLISAGFDAAAADPLAQMQVSTAGFTWMTRQLLEVAARRCGGRVVSVLEGGYDLEALASGVAAHVAELLAAANGGGETLYSANGS